MVNNNNNKTSIPITDSGLGLGIASYRSKPLTLLVSFMVFGIPMLWAFILLWVIPKALFAPLTKIIAQLS